MRVTYSQDWANYNAAQTHEQEHFVSLLRDLCNGIRQPAQTFGRPRLPLADVIFGLVFKSYTMMSGRRFTSALKEAQDAGLISKAAHYNSAFRYLENPELIPLLKTLIEQSSSPLRVIKGGSWYFCECYLRPANRNSADVHRHDSGLGFRLALDAD